jgi:hypothetical protein
MFYIMHSEPLVWSKVSHEVDRPRDFAFLYSALADDAAK